MVRLIGLTFFFSVSTILSPVRGQQQGRDSDVPIHFKIRVERIPGLTTQPHHLEKAVLPLTLDTPATLTIRRQDGTGKEKVSFTWIRATELSDSNGVSSAVFSSPSAGDFRIVVIPNVDGVDSLPILVSAQVHPVHPEEVRILLNVPEADFATFVGNPFTLTGRAEPEAFTDWIEWRAPRHNPDVGFGGSFTTRRNLVGDHYPITASFEATKDPPRVSVMVYRVEWVSKPGRRDYRSGPILRLYHQIRTVPSGYEDRVTWSYSTLNTGEASPSTGKGRVFTTTRTVFSTQNLICWRTYADNAFAGGDMTSGPTELLRKEEQNPHLDASWLYSVPVGAANGEALVTVTDLEVPSRGFPFRWTRVYSSRADFDHALGYNWDHSYNRRIGTGSGNASVTNGNSHEDVYSKTGPDTFESPAGFFDVLMQNLCDSTYTLTDVGGMQHKFDASGYLIEQKDRNGNVLTITRNSFHNPTQIVDTQGRIYTFTYTDGTSSQRIKKISDFNTPPREVEYTYDPCGDLIQVRSPVVSGTPNSNDFPSGKTTLYTYSACTGDTRLRHNLRSIIEPLYNVSNNPSLSKAWVTLTYATTTNPKNEEFDQVVAQRWGHDMGGPPSNPNIVVGGTSFYAYSSNLIGDADAPAGAVKRTTFTDRRDPPLGNVSVHYFNSSAHEIKTIERTNRSVRPNEGDYITTRTFTTEGFLLSITLPRGNSVTHTYNSGSALRRSQGNLLEIRRSDGSLGTDPDLATGFSYDPVFNQVHMVTDPRGFIRTRYFDYQERSGFQSSQGIPPSERISEGLGDLNGDGVTTEQEGNVVKLEEPKIMTAGPNFGDQSATLYTYNTVGQVLTMKDPEGTVTAYEYFAAMGGPNDPSDKEGYLKKETRDSTGFMLDTQYDYDFAGNRTKVTDPKGQVTDYSVNQLNQVVRVLSRQLGGSIRYQEDRFYDLNDEIIETRYSNLDENGVPFAHASVVNQYEYNILHYPVAEIRDKSRNGDFSTTTVRTEYFYDENLNRTAVKRPQGNFVTTLYDERDLPYHIVTGDSNADPEDSPPSTASIRTQNYDANGNLLEVIDAVDDAVNPGAPTTIFAGSGAGDVTRHEYDGFDRRIRIVDAEGNEHETEYDPNSNPMSSTDEGPKDESNFTLSLLTQVDRVYDEMNRVVTATESHFDTATGSPVGDGLSVTTYEYDLDSKLVATTDDQGRVSEVDWDSADRRSVERDARLNEVQYTYDDNGNVTQMTRVESSSDVGGSTDTYVTMYTYDALDRRIKRVDAAGDVMEWFYDSRGNVVRTSDGVRGSGHPGGPGNIVRYEYDALNRLVETKRDLTSNGRGDGSVTDTIVTTQAYDDNSNLTSETNDMGYATSFEYDILDRRTRVMYADATSKLYTYDNDHHVTTWTDPKGTVCTQDWDGLDRLIARDVTVFGSGVLGSSFEDLGYDGLSRITHTANDDGIAGSMTCDFRYDSFSNTVREDQMGTLVMSGFDGLSNRTSLTYPLKFGGGTRALTYTYDALNRRRATVSDGSTLSTHSYKGPRRLARRTNGIDATPSSKLDLSYDSDPRVIELLHRTGSNVLIAGFQYGHDRMDHRQFEKRTHNSNKGDVYAYDSIYRVATELEDVDLTSVSPGQEIDPSLFSSNDSFAFTYDGVGNRISHIEKTAGTPTTTTYTQDPNAPKKDKQVNQYTTTQEGVNPAVNYVYDSNGNMTNDGTLKYAYDFKNRLVEVRNAGTSALIAQYSYDAADRRVMKIDSRSDPAVTTHYVFDRQQVIEERDMSLLRQYVWGPGTDELLEEKTTSLTLYAHETAVGSIAALVNASGTSVERYDYDAFGRTIVTLDGSTGNRYRFQGSYHDAETGLYHFRNRTYNPALGRFLQRLGIGVDAGEFNLFNRLTFAGNDYVNRVNPAGLGGERQTGIPASFRGRALEARASIASGVIPNRPPLAMIKGDRTWTSPFVGVRPACRHVLASDAGRSESGGGKPEPRLTIQHRVVSGGGSMGGTVGSGGTTSMMGVLYDPSGEASDSSLSASVTRGCTASSEYAAGGGSKGGSAAASDGGAADSGSGDDSTSKNGGGLGDITITTAPHTTPWRGGGGTSGGGTIAMSDAKKLLE